MPIMLFIIFGYFRSHNHLCLLMVCTLLCTTPLTAQERVIRAGISDAPLHWDPQYCDSSSSQSLFAASFLGLMTQDEYGQTQAGTAKSYHLSQDGLTYTFYLRPELVWSDGEPMTAHDYVASYRRVLTTKNPPPYIHLLYLIVNAYAISQGTAKEENLAVNAIDKHTLQIKLTQPAPYFLDLLTHCALFALPHNQASLAVDGAVRNSSHVSNGAYRVVLSEKNEITLIQNPLFYDVATLKLDRLHFIVHHNYQELVQLFNTKELDIISDPPYAILPWIKKNYPKQLSQTGGTGIYFLALNQRNDHLKNAAIVKALSMAIDRELLAHISRGKYRALYTLTPSQFYQDHAKPNTPFDPTHTLADKTKQAHQLLLSAGYTQQKPLKLALSYNKAVIHQQLMLAIHDMWKTLPVEVVLKPESLTTHYQSLTAGEFEIARVGWQADYVDPYAYLVLFSRFMEDLNYSHYHNISFDNLLDLANKTQHQAKRAQLLAEAETLILNDSPLIPLLSSVRIAVTSPRIAGYRLFPIGASSARWWSTTQSGE